MSAPAPQDKPFEDDLALAHALANLSRPLALKAFNQALAVERKADFSPVTQADRDIERSLREALARARPQDGILGEEEAGHQLDAERVWVIDPIDGTRAFILGIPLFSTLIALCVAGKPVLGLLDFPALAQTYTGLLGQPSKLNGQPLRVRSVPQLSTATFCATSPDMFSASEQASVAALRAQVADWRWGMDAFGFAALARGRLDGLVESDLKPYDFLAMVPLIEGAGGCISDWQGAPLTLKSGPQVLAASSKVLHAAALAQIQA